MAVSRPMPAKMARLAMMSLMFSRLRVIASRTEPPPATGRSGSSAATTRRTDSEMAAGGTEVRRMIDW